MTTAPMKTAAFKDCDIRGTYPAEVDESLVGHVGRAFAERVHANRFPGLEAGTVVLGGDARLSTPVLRDALVAGLMTRPVHVVDLGRVPTPVVYWAKARRRFQGSAIVTASHNPPSWNGLKLTNGPLPPTAEDIMSLADDLPPAGPEAKKSGRRSEWLSATADYLDEQAQSFAGRGIDRLSVVVDPGSGCFAGLASGLFERLGARVVALHDTIDGLFTRRHPDCAVPEHLTALSEAVVERGADLGIAFDGDGDRIAVVDGCGRVLGTERLAMIMLGGVFDNVVGSPVILDIKCSMHLERKVAALGAEPVRCRSGHAYMKRQVLERRAVAGFELSGHVFLGHMDARDDPLCTSLLLMAWLGDKGYSLADLVDDLPMMVMTPDIRIAATEDRIASLLVACAEGLGDARVERLDGVRLVWPDGWVLARRSITEPKVTIRLEGETPESLQRIGTLFCGRFPDLRAPISEAVRAALSAAR